MESAASSRLGAQTGHISNCRKPTHLPSRLYPFGKGEQSTRFRLVYWETLFNHCPVRPYLSRLDLVSSEEYDPGSENHFFSGAAQFSTTVMGGADGGAASAGTQLI